MRYELLSQCGVLGLPISLEQDISTPAVARYGKCGRAISSS